MHSHNSSLSSSQKAFITSCYNYIFELERSMVYHETIQDRATNPTQETKNSSLRRAHCFRNSFNSWNTFQLTKCILIWSLGECLGQRDDSSLHLCFALEKTQVQHSLWDQLKVPQRIRQWDFSLDFLAKSVEFYCAMFRNHSLSVFLESMPLSCIDSESCI